MTKPSRINTGVITVGVANDTTISANNDIENAEANSIRNRNSFENNPQPIIQTSENRSLTSSLRRLITITFRRNQNSSSSKKPARSAHSNNDRVKRSQNKKDTLQASTFSQSLDSEIAFSKTGDKNYSGETNNIATDRMRRFDNSLANSLTSTNNNNNNNNNGKARSLYSRNSDASVQTEPVISSKKYKSDQRTNSQPDPPKPDESKSAISLEDAINNLSCKSNSQTTFNSNYDSEKNTTTTTTTININANNYTKENTSDTTSQKEQIWTPTSASKSQTSKQSNNKNNPITGATTLETKNLLECPLCIFPIIKGTQLNGCKHIVCLECMQRYIITEINHSRTQLTCPMCSESIHPNAIKSILQNEEYYLKYESFMLRRVLAAEPDARWCPAPDCGYVVLANGCASCPKLVCGREGCDTSFCYHCKQEWHPNQTCIAASIQRNKRQLVNAYNINDLFETIDDSSAQQAGSSSSSNRKSSKSSHAPKSSTLKPDDIKECPVCASRIIKMNDGSCNHMTCSICLTEFCWLCMKEISDLHYFSPSGCTFWGRKPWSRKKKLLWQLGMLVGAPICIILISGVAVPAIIIGIPVYAARKLHNRLERKPFSRYKKNAIVTGGVLLSFLISPVISAVALAIGIPVLLFYIYGVVPISLCRSSGGCLSSAPSLENIQNNLRNVNIIPIAGTVGNLRSAGSETSRTSARDGLSIAGGDPSIGETSIYLSNISLETNSIGRITNVEREDRESASNAALAGSIISNPANGDEHSTKALAGSIMSKESGYTVPVEVHVKSSSVAGQ